MNRCVQGMMSMLILTGILGGVNGCSTTRPRGPYSAAAAGRGDLLNNQASSVGVQRRLPFRSSDDGTGDEPPLPLQTSPSTVRLWFYLNDRLRSLFATSGDPRELSPGEPSRVGHAPEHFQNGIVDRRLRAVVHRVRDLSAMPVPLHAALLKWAQNTARIDIAAKPRGLAGNCRLSL